MKNIHTNNGRIFKFLELPNTASRLIIYSGSEPTIFYYIKENVFDIDLSKGNYKIISEDISTMSESEVSVVVTTLWNGYMNYELKNQPVGNYARYVKNTAIESLKSLTQSLGMDIDKRYCLLEIIK